MLSCLLSLGTGRMKRMSKPKTALPIFTLASSLTIGLLLSDVTFDRKPAKIMGFSVCEIDGHPVIFRATRSSAVVSGELIWIPPSSFEKIITSVDDLEKPECARAKTFAKCAGWEEDVICWVYSTVTPPVDILPWEPRSFSGDWPDWKTS